MANEFTVTRESPTNDVPAITLHVRGDTMRAEMANGAKLYAEVTGRGDADVRVQDATGNVLADITVRTAGLSRDNLTDSVADIGAALLWSHWRYCEVLKAKPIDEMIAKSSIGAGLADIKERGIDAHLADAEEGEW